MLENTILFEISWEVCNKVGGINTVLISKAAEAKAQFGENYILIGPSLEHNDNFVESDSPFCQSISKALLKQKLQCRVGYWDIPAKPTVILVSYKDRYNTNELLRQLWEDFELDSYQGSYDYVEPILFSTAAAEAIKIICEQNIIPSSAQIAHCHEWLSGASILYIEKHAPQITTVFTTHATILGRTLAKNRVNIYNLPEDFNPDSEAKKNGIAQKHSLEKISARTADCFTAVSTLIADECQIMLGIYPDKATLNGLNIEEIQKIAQATNKKSVRKTLLSVASQITGEDISKDSIILMTSGRFELHNKGYDIFLRSIKNLQGMLGNDTKPIVVFFMVSKKYCSAKDSLLSANKNETKGFLTHRIDNPDQDEILQLCQSLQLNQEKDKIKVIYSPAYLNQHDGVFNLSYQEILASVDLTVFPSFYEPWGYTPFESLAYSVPSITTDTTGFGNWILNLINIGEYQDAISIIRYKNKEEDEVINFLTEELKLQLCCTCDPEKQARAKTSTLAIAKLGDWKNFYSHYVDAYTQALEANQTYGLHTTTDTTIQELETKRPKLHRLTSKPYLPESLKNLEKLAYNFCWTWHPEAEALFRELDERLWEKQVRNPVLLLNNISQKTLLEKAKDKKYIENFNSIIEKFENYCKIAPTNTFCQNNLISPQHPLAYLCLEYGLAECLPIYAGGLGILAGDYLKTLSDLDLPTIAFGLLYKGGYCYQSVNEKGEQIDSFVSNDPGQLPIKPLTDESGSTVIVTVEVADQPVQLKVWEAQIGRITLYLLDSDVSTNSHQNREITHQLYTGTRENRFLQELILGQGSIRLLSDYLDIKPAIYHLNEGHSGLALLELIKEQIKQGNTFEEAKTLVKASSIFTTHTSVPAGSELFSTLSIKKYLAPIAKSLGIPLKKVLALGEHIEPIPEIFSLTALTFRCTIAQNAVSQLHQQVASQLWFGFWPSFLKTESPIQAITNGVHITTWLGDEIYKLYQKHLISFDLSTPEISSSWETIQKIQNNEIWEAHQKQKENLIILLKKRIIKEYTERNEDANIIDNALSALKPDALLIGFARRLATYKRHHLILQNKSRLARILTDSERPVTIVISGKAHPSDPGGRQILKEIIQAMHDPVINARIIFIENYDIDLAKQLVQGCDLWLNTPVIHTEACGTSGMKAGINGVLNFSIKDGWWAEAYSKELGWAIETAEDDLDPVKRDHIEGLFLLDTLEQSIIPCYYTRNKNNMSDQWIKMMKNSMQHITAQYNSHRMASDYLEKLYCPVATYSKMLTKEKNKNLKKLVAWKADIEKRFKTVVIKTTLINGIKNGEITANENITIQVLLLTGKCTTNELKVEFLLTEKSDTPFDPPPIIITLKPKDIREEGIVTYVGELNSKGLQADAYSIRVYPYHPLLFRPQDAGIVYWE